MERVSYRYQMKSSDISQRGEKVSVSIVSFPIGKAFAVPLSNLSNVLGALTKTYVIAGTYEQIPLQKKSDNLHTSIIPYQFGPSVIIQVLRYSILQIKIAYKLVLLRKQLKCIFFFMESVPILPMLIARTVRIPIYWFFPSKIMDITNGIKPKVERIFSKICYWFCDGIIIYSDKLLSSWELEPYRHKILIAHEHFLDFNTLTVTTPYIDRRFAIGFIGRLSEEKGVQYFVQALPAILRDQQDLRVLIGGDGGLRKVIEATLKEDELTDRVDLIGWIPHDGLTRHLNQLRLLILPSETEGLPNIMLEAMACGTPVLVTPVGAITDVIVDGETGFIMENNSPECIAKHVIRALNSPQLEIIAENGRQYVRENFSFEKVVVHWNRVLKQI